MLCGAVVVAAGFTVGGRTRKVFLRWAGLRRCDSGALARQNGAAAGIKRPNTVGQSYLLTFTLTLEGRIIQLST